jgi:mono/diheme cytochrome c family protein
MIVERMLTQMTVLQMSVLQMTMVLATMLMTSASAADRAADAADAEGRVVRQFISKNCLSCHSSEKKKGDTDLERLTAPGTTTDADHLWENVRRSLAEQTMPPENKPQPPLAERERIVAWIDRALDGPNGDVPTDPGWVTIHRLTRLEYNNTIKDLLGVGGTPSDAFPADTAGGSGSFDNNADTLYVSPMLVERMLDVVLSLIEDAKPERLYLVAPEADRKGVITPAAQKKALEASLTNFLPLAWRRPVTPYEVQTLARVYDRAKSRNKISDKDALYLTYAAALTSPNFLYRIEISKPGNEPYAISAYELANRLSYFLWSSMPDATLFAAAADNSLVRPEVLLAQVKRLLSDPRARIFTKQFMGQWLGTSDLGQGLGPDAKIFKEFTSPLRNAMVEEPAAFIYALLQENGTLTDLIDCNYVYVNKLLAQHYGLTSPSSNEREFSKVMITDGRRGGLVTMAGVLAVTSRPARTSPVIRGKWILDELLSYPPPPPPPNVPELVEAENEKAIVGTVRQRLEHHRSDPNCNGCHQRIDPLGFGLENYDALGRWRTRDEHGGALDTTGTMPGGETFSGPQQLKQLLKQRQDRIMTTLIERVLSYALGRSIERYDRATVRAISAKLAADGWRSQTLINEIVLSLPFRYKRNPTVTENSPVANPPVSKNP